MSNLARVLRFIKYHAFYDVVPTDRHFETACKFDVVYFVINHHVVSLKHENNAIVLIIDRVKYYDELQVVYKFNTVYSKAF